MFKRSLVVAFLFTVVSSVVYCHTDVPGGLVSGHWTLNGSPYIVHGDIHIAGLEIDPGVEVLVDGDCGIDVDVALIADGEPDQRIIFTATDSVNRWRGIRFENVAPGSILDHCNVEYANNCGIRLINSTPTIQDCIVSNNTSPGYGGGIYASLDTGTLVLIGCKITDNTASPPGSSHAYGGGVFVSGNSQIFNCEIARNVCYAHSSSGLKPVSHGGGLYVSGGTHEIRTTMIAENSSSSFFHFSGVSGSSTAYGGGIYMGTGDFEMYNSVVAGNTVKAWDDGGSTPNYHQGGGIRSSGNSNFHNIVITKNKYEGIYIAGGAAFVRNSILYFNSTQAYGSVTIDYSDFEGVWSGSGTGNIDYNPAFTGTGFDAWDYRISSYSPCVDKGDPHPDYYDGCRPPAHGDLRNDMGAFGGPDNGDWFRYSEVLVDDDWSGSNPGDPVGEGHLFGYDAFDKIQEGIDRVLTGGTVHVADGTYKGGGNRDLDFFGRTLTLKSENGPDACIIDCEQSARGFYFQNGEGPGSRVEGFTIYNGWADDGGGMCLISSSPAVIHCTFLKNSTSGSGGGMYTFGSSATVTQCTFKENSASLEGGGMYNAVSSPTVIQCTFEGNSASLVGGGGGMYNSSSSPTVTNCILWNDTSPEIHNTGSSSSKVTYSCIQGGHTGTGNIDTDPLFVDATQGDLHLRYTSPCKDTGDNTVPSLPETDFEGDPRIADGTVDMGVDEFYTHLYYTGDATPGGTVALKFTGAPDSVIRLWLSAGLLETPFPTKFGDWYLDFPLIFGLILGSMPNPDGVLEISATIPLDTAVPVSASFQAGIGLELTNPCVIEIK